ncbi:MAG: hypothetical protein IKV10_04270 [Alphaproteobacteria bacterium]|nr:hypothetical protein [Alphaproteobacteria bacterium]
MTILHNILNTYKNSKLATDVGTRTHAELRHVFFDGVTWHGNGRHISKIKNNPELERFFTIESATEVPIAGLLNNHFVSRRIDRLLIDKNTQEIFILDYKTDINSAENRGKYYQQIKEYSQLLHKLYPNYKISGYILWTHDFSLEKAI